MSGPQEGRRSRLESALQWGSSLSSLPGSGQPRRHSACRGCKARRGRGTELTDSLREIPSVIFDPAYECRTAGVLPGEAEEVETRRIRDAATVHRRAALIENGRVDP